MKTPSNLHTRESQAGLTPGALLPVNCPKHLRAKDSRYHLRNQPVRLRIAVFGLSILLLPASGDKSVALAQEGDASNAVSISIKVLGTGDLWRDYPTAFLITYNTKRILVDCGKNRLPWKSIPNTLTPWKSIPNTLTQSDIPINLILLTHFHDDHKGGLPDFSDLNCGATDMVIAGEETGIEKRKDEYGFKGYTLIKMKSEQPYEFFDSSDIVRVHTFKVSHKTTDSLGYRITFLRDNVVVGFTGDTAYCSNIARIVKNVDLAFIDCTSYDGTTIGDDIEKHTQYKDDLLLRVGDYKPARFPLYIVHYNTAMLNHMTEINGDVSHRTAEYGQRLRLAERGDTFVYRDNGFERNGDNTKHTLERPVLEKFSTSQGWTPEMARHLADVNGDARVDIVGLMDDGVHVAYAKDAPGSPTDFPEFEEETLVLNDFPCAKGYGGDDYPLFLCDVNGDKRQDIVGFGHSSVRVALAKASTTFSKDSPFESVRENGPAFSYQAGWRSTSLRVMADVDGDKRDDIVGFSSKGPYVAFAKRNDDDSFPFGPAHLATPLMFAPWDSTTYPILTADVDGDGGADIVGFGNVGVQVSFSTKTRGATAFTPPTLQNNYPYYGFEVTAGGWRVDDCPRFLADVNGDGCADIVGFGYHGVSVALATGNRNTPFGAPERVLNSFSYSEGSWRVDRHLRLVTDINGDSRADIVGFSNAGVVVATAKAAGFPASDPIFNTPTRIIDAYGRYAEGWQVENHPRILGDVNNDGLKEIVGFGDFGVFVTRLDDCPNDTDSDSMPDGWEIHYGMKPATVGDGLWDQDHDGLTAVREYEEGTNPLKFDTDDDGLPDGWEVQYGMNPGTAGDELLDQDKDQLTAVREYEEGTNPLKSDTDDDGLPDGWEFVNLLNPKVKDANNDPDGDGMTNSEEYPCGTDPQDAESVLRIESAMVGSSSGELTICWQSTTGKSYQVYCSEDFTAGNWSNVSGIISATSGRTCWVTNPLQPGTRFYRVVLSK